MTAQASGTHEGELGSLGYTEVSTEGMIHGKCAWRFLNLTFGFFGCDIRGGALNAPLAS